MTEPTDPVALLAATEARALTMRTPCGDGSSRSTYSQNAARNT